MEPSDFEDGPPLADVYELPDVRVAAAAVTGEPVAGLPLAPSVCRCGHADGNHAPGEKRYCVFGPCVCADYEAATGREAER